MANETEPGGPYLDAIRGGFQFAREQGRSCGPADLLVGISEGDGAAAAALDPGAGQSLRAVLAADRALGTGAGYLQMQAQGAATSLAESRAERATPEHLLIALLDQGTPEVVQTLSRAGLDPAEVRRKALAAIGAHAGLPPVAMPALPPAGTMDHPPLPVADLDARAWAVLRWRQDHLPLRRVHRASDAAALDHLERHAAWRVAARLGLSEDQRYSLISHHADAVQQAMARAPGMAGWGGPRGPGPRSARGRLLTGGPVPGPRGTPAVYAHVVRALRRPRFAGLPILNVTVGWGTWMRNRETAARYGWFRLRTTSDYRGCPRP